MEPELRTLSALLTAVFSSNNPVTASVLVTAATTVNQNPLTIPKLIETLLFQIVALGLGSVFLYLKIIPAIIKRQGMHPITFEEQESIRKSPLRIIFGQAKRWYNHMWWSLASTLMRGGATIIVTIVLAILLTDVGWIKSWNTYVHTEIIDGTPITFGIPEFLVMARASGAPNGAHLLSYIPVVCLGIYVAYKTRDNRYSVSYDFMQGALVIGFLVAVHEGFWLIEYWAEFAKYWNLAVASNIIEDFGFGGTCILMAYAFWKYPFRTIPMRTFKWPVIAQMGVWVYWYLLGLPITTINNWQLGEGTFMITKYWGDPFVNALEIFSWVSITLLFGIAIWHESYKRQKTIRG